MHQIGNEKSYKSAGGFMLFFGEKCQKEMLFLCFFTKFATYNLKCKELK